MLQDIFITQGILFGFVPAGQVFFNKTSWHLPQPGMSRAILFLSHRQTYIKILHYCCVNSVVLK